jgi:phospholipid/cholesterol/gamma-HCH transport system substrate-binding protein
MRRIASIGLLAALAGLIALVVGTSAQGSSTYTFDVIFDNGRGLIGGQLVKIAGAKAGTISNATVYHGNQAQIEASVDGKFRFHQDATCTIRPEGLIAENYVNCDPGSASAPLLQGINGRPPTVPVTHTQEPVSLLDLFNIFNLPTRERFQVLIDELGIATAGRGDDINQIILRANPALGLARQVIGILARQKTQLATIIDATNTIAAQGAGHTAAVQDFIQRADSLATLTANHASSLSQAIARLPGNLAAAQPSLAQLDTVAKDGTPLLGSIRAAVPYLNRVNNDVVPFAAAAQPALAQLSTAINGAIPAVRAATPLVRTLNTYIKQSAPATALFAKLAPNLIHSGFSENFFSVVYYVAAALSRYDSTGHLLSVLLMGPDNGLCGNYATTPVAACSAHYGAQAAYTPQRRGAHHSSAPRTGTSRPTTPTTAAPASTTPTVTTPAAPTGVTGLTTGISNVVKKVVSSLPGITPTGARQNGQALQNLVNYLLK